MICLDEYTRQQVACATAAAPSWEWWHWVILIVVVIIVLWIVWSLAIDPIYSVWAQHQEGLADLAQAKNEQQIQVAQAQGRLDAAEINKKAAVIEAEAVANQIKTIGDQLTHHDLYLRWQWIEMMKHRNADADTIYVPTEAGLPILEAGKRVV